MVGTVKVAEDGLTITATVTTIGAAMTTNGAVGAIVIVTVEAEASAAAAATDTRVAAVTTDKVIVDDIVEI